MNTAEICFARSGQSRFTKVSGSPFSTRLDRLLAREVRDRFGAGPVLEGGLLAREDADGALVCGVGGEPDLTPHRIVVVVERRAGAAVGRQRRRRPLRCRAR